MAATSFWDSVGQNLLGGAHQALTGKPLPGTRAATNQELYGQAETAVLQSWLTQLKADQNLTPEQTAKRTLQFTQKLGELENKLQREGATALVPLLLNVADRKTEIGDRSFSNRANVLTAAEGQRTQGETEAFVTRDKARTENQIAGLDAYSKSVLNPVTQAELAMFGQSQADRYGFGRELIQAYERQNDKLLDYQRERDQRENGGVLGFLGQLASVAAPIAGSIAAFG